MRWRSAVALALAGASFVGGLKVELNARDESRRVFSVEEFGFLEGGFLRMQVSDFKFSPSEGGQRAGFIIFEATSEQGILEHYHEEIKEEYSKRNRTCPFDDQSMNALFSMEFKSASNVREQTKEMTITKEQEGLYEVSYVSCGADAPVSFNFVGEMKNPGGFLSAGAVPPGALFFFSFVYLLMVVGWIRIIRRNASEGNVHKIHHLLTAFMVLKLVATLSWAVDQHYVKVYGTSPMWDFLSHLLKALKALMFFVVVILLGTGWSLIRATLDEREKKILIAIFPLQILANIALVVADELPVGSTGFMKWKNAFQLFDLVCCFVVAIPLFGHIQRLEQRLGQGKSNDGKRSVELAKLKQFRRFYLLVLSYIYFTRVIVFLVGNNVNFKLRYLETVFTEIASIVFYCIIAYIFRPTPRASYLEVASSESDAGDEEDPFDRDMFYDQDEEHESEFGLGDSIEMTSITATTARR